MNEDRSAEGEGPSEIDKILEQARGAKTGKEMAEAYNRFDKWAIGSPDTPFGEKAAYRAQLDARSAGIPPDGTTKYAPRLSGEFRVEPGKPAVFDPLTEKLGPEHN